MKVCPNCDHHLNVVKDAIVEKGPFDPMKISYFHGVTNEKIFGLMIEKMTSEIKTVMEKPAPGIQVLETEKFQAVVLSYEDMPQLFRYVDDI
jgi:hypothetical protein